MGVHGLHYGSGVFEGIRCYETSKGPAVFRLPDHLQRLELGQLLYMDMPYSVEELRQATHELLATNGLASCYVRPIAFYGYSETGVAATDNPIDVAIMSWPWGAYLGESSQEQGITATISGWERVGPNVIPHAAKATGVYLNSMLATTEARRAGYDGDHALARRLHRRQAWQNDLRHPRRSADAAPRDVDLPGNHRDGDRHCAGRSATGRRDACSSAGSLPRGRGLHGRDGDRGGAGSSVDDRRSASGRSTLRVQKAYLGAVNGLGERWTDWLDLVEMSRPPAEV